MARICEHDWVLIPYSSTGGGGMQCSKCGEPKKPTIEFDTFKGPGEHIPDSWNDIPCPHNRWKNGPRGSNTRTCTECGYTERRDKCMHEHLTKVPHNMTAKCLQCGDFVSQRHIVQMKGHVDFTWWTVLISTTGYMSMSMGEDTPSPMRDKFEMSFTAKWDSDEFEKMHKAMNRQFTFTAEGNDPDCAHTWQDIGKGPNGIHYKVCMSCSKHMIVDCDTHIFPQSGNGKKAPQCVHCQKEMTGIEYLKSVGRQLRRNERKSRRRKKVCQR